MTRRAELVAAAVVVLIFTSIGTGRAAATEQPGTVSREWMLRWPERGQTDVIVKRFAHPGLIRRVRVLIGGEPVPGPPYIAVVGCKGTRFTATAQKAWLWDGRGVHLALLLDPGRCPVAGTKQRVRVILTSVGT